MGGNRFLKQRCPTAELQHLIGMPLMRGARLYPDTAWEETILSLPQAMLTVTTLSEGIKISFSQAELPED